jgi:hypothetical protein
MKHNDSWKADSGSTSKKLLAFYGTRRSLTVMFAALVAVTMNSVIFCNVTSCILVEF